MPVPYSVLALAHSLLAALGVITAVTLTSDVAVREWASAHVVSAHAFITVQSLALIDALPTSLDTSFLGRPVLAITAAPVSSAEISRTVLITALPTLIVVRTSVIPTSPTSSPHHTSSPVDLPAPSIAAAELARALSSDRRGWQMRAVVLRVALGLLLLIVSLDHTVRLRLSARLVLTRRSSFGALELCSRPSVALSAVLSNASTASAIVSRRVCTAAASTRLDMCVVAAFELI